MRDAASGSGRENWQPQQAHLIFQIFREEGGQIAPENKNAASFIKALRQGGEPLCVQTVLQALQIFQILTERIAHIGGHVGITTAVLHGVERSRESKREFVQMVLKCTVTGKAESANNAHDGGRVRVQALGYGPN